MKKVLSLILALVIFCTLAGCRRAVVENVRDEINNAGNNNADNKEFLSGTSFGGVYTNTFSGIGFKLPLDMDFLSDEEMREMNNLALDAMGEELADQIASLDLVYDMYASDETSTKTINILFEKMSSSSPVDMEDYIRPQIPSLKSGLESMGYTNITVNATDVNVGGRALKGVRVKANHDGFSLYETVFCWQVNNYIVNVTVASVDESDIQVLLNAFYWLS